MSVIQGGGLGSYDNYQLTNSVRLRASANGYFSRTYGTPTSATTWTISMWCKRTTFGVLQHLFANVYSAQLNSLSFGTDNSLLFWGSNVESTHTTALFRDPTAWYHIAVSNNAGTQTIWVNNLQVLQVTASVLLNQAVLTGIGCRADGSYNPFDGYISDVYFIDGQALGSSSFAENGSNGVWVPKVYTGTYGTNGFHLDFKDANLTSGSNVGLGKDVSTNSNYWSTSGGISVTAGKTYDSMIDTPSNNYATFATVDPTLATVSGGGLDVLVNGSYNRAIRSSFGIPPGKWYWETTKNDAGTNLCIGIADSKIDLNNINGLGYLTSSISFASGAVYDSGNYITTSIPSLAINDVVAVAYDTATGKVWFAKQTGGSGSFVWLLSSNPATNTGGYTGYPETTQYFPAAGGAYSNSQSINFGQRPFNNSSIPTGFKSLCTANLPVVPIPKPANYFFSSSRTANGSSFNVTGKPFKPDLVWIKGRSGGADHAIYDSVRGVQKDMASNTTGAETTEAQGVTAFNTDGFSGGTLAKINTNAINYMDWGWKAGDAAVTNSVGSINSQVSASVISGVAVVTYTGTGANATVGHGLGIAPKFIITKARNPTAAENWNCWHIGLTSAAYRICLNLTNAQDTSGSLFWNSTAPTSTVFSLGAWSGNNESGKLNVAYCFAEIAGYSKFGSYTGNASTDGAFVYLGFRPKTVFIKSSSTTDNWRIYDNNRPGYNVIGGVLFANDVTSEGFPAELDFLSNGFKLRTSTTPNASQTYIYAAFSRYPFGGSNVSPTIAA